jgi:hypothetical protein
MVVSLLVMLPPGNRHDKNECPEVLDTTSSSRTREPKYGPSSEHPQMEVPSTPYGGDFRTIMKTIPTAPDKWALLAPLKPWWADHFGELVPECPVPLMTW